MSLNVSSPVSFELFVSIAVLNSLIATDPSGLVDLNATVTV